VDGLGVAEEEKVREALEKRLEELGSKFCNVLTEAEIKHMEKVIEDWRKGEIHEMTRDLESLDFFHTVASKICRVEEKE
jgi:hypothetical protein